MGDSATAGVSGATRNWKRQEGASPGSTPLPYLDPSSGSCWDFWSQNWEGVKVSCSQLPGVRCFVTAARTLLPRVISLMQGPPLAHPDLVPIPQTFLETNTE